MNIIEVIKVVRREPQTAETLSYYTNSHVSNAHRQLAALYDAGLVDRAREKHPSSKYPVFVFRWVP